VQARALRALEFDIVLERLARQALTPLGRDRALALEPLTDARAIADALALTSEAVAYRAAGGALGLSAPDDLDQILELLNVGGQVLEPLQLLGLARFVESVDQTVGGIRRAADDRPRLAAMVAPHRAFTAEVQAVRRAIDPAGDVSDNASPALKEIRERLRRQRAKLRSTLEGLARDRDTAKYLQDQIVTDRNGRYVLVVRAEHREGVPGIVHGSSASGQSLYLEPLATVELNNETVTLAEKEVAEIRRILTSLTSAFQRRGEDLDALVTAAADIDLLQAKAELAISLDAIAPALATDGRLDWKGARHPLVDGAVASDLAILPPHRALVISGPNTGGKTVALKAFGLLAVMAQSGLLVPVDKGSAFTPFASVFADIGDDQSISASLSTFSAHIAHLVDMERSLELPALVLLDEVGSGTDPVEGGALGTAVIDHFITRGATVVATTHDDALKSYAATTAAVSTAAFGFVAETYAPTYRLVYGAPGRSLALEIAQRLGMPESVVADARRRRSGRESQLAAHLARVVQELAALDREKIATERVRDALEAERRALVAREARLAEREAVLKRRMDDKLNERLREARAEVDKVVAELKAKAGALGDRSEPRLVTTGDIGGLRADARASLDAIGRELDSPAAEPAGDHALTEIPPDGTKVFVPALGSEGIVRGGQGKNVEVEVRGKRMRVKLADLRSRGAAAAASRGAVTTPAAARARSTAAAPVSMELVVIGSTVDEANDKIAKFVDQALMADARVLRIVHGHGTGKLREAVRAFFHKHPLVESVAMAPDNQGGAGATIVTLRD
jgi:DNA mismatch repair protein MutS2